MTIHETSWIGAKWMADNGSYFAKISNGSDTTHTTGTVPAGKTWYITASSLGYKRTGTTSGQYVSLKIGGDEVAQLFCSDADNYHDVISLSFPIPIKLTAGQTVKFYSSASDAYGWASIIGYEF